ncbi:uncharacterized protein LOC104455608 [Eucalyptus grandis]|uniref:uncharacterized protein LOC104455608 n=1 Tax=Eucalyptus grandis TaxID=71139 RepID=UPI00192EFF83|nr:uncharacterized protein LOC104455608 [Eucalyptus grandis]
MAGAFLASVASNLVSKVGEYLIAPIGRQFGYVLCYKSNVKDLKNRVDELKNAKARVQHSVEEARNNGKPIHADVKGWLEKVEEAEKANILLEPGENAKDTCLRWWIPNPMVQHRSGRKVKKMTQVIQGLYDKAQNSNFTKVSYENTPAGIVTTTTSTARSVDRKDVLDLRASIIEDVMKALVDDKVCVIGVHGIGGVGKSKLLEDVEQRVKEEKLFDVVATANISLNPDLKKIQGEIAYALGLNLMNEETAHGRADRLRQRCAKLKVIEPGVLGSLENIEELYMADSFNQWEVEGEAPRRNASLAELKNMKKLSTLHIAIPHSTNFSSDLPFGELKKYRIQIGNIWDWSGEYKESRTLKLKLESDNLLLRHFVQKCLQRTQDLHLHGLQDGEDSIPDLCIFRELKHLHVQNNPSLQYIFPPTEIVQSTAFSNLESLFLENLNNLEKISRNNLDLEFGKLKIMKLDNCGVIKHLFPLSMARVCLQLEEIELSGCHSMKQFVANDEADENRDAVDDDCNVKLSNLQRLTLRNLSVMTSFWIIMDHSNAFFNGQQVSLPRLESLTLSELPKLKEIWNSQFLSNVSSLKFLKVEDCMLLRSIIPSNLLMKLQNLEAITVKRCQLIQEVFNLEGLTANGDVEILSQLAKLTVLFPSLEELTLLSLHGLRRIWHNELPKESFCKLASLTVRDCENLSHIIPSTLIGSFQSLEMIEAVKCTSLETLIEHVPFNTEKSQKCQLLLNIKEVKLWHLPGLIAVGTSNTKATLHLPKLTNISLCCCHSLTYLLTNNVARTCDQLEMVDISDCKKMQEVVAVEEDEEQNLGTVKFSQLRTLKLWSLKSLIRFSSGRCSYEFPSLSNFSILECTQLKAFIQRPPAPSVEMMNEEATGSDEGHISQIRRAASNRIQSRELWENEMSDESIRCLKVLKVKRCHNLLNVIPSSMWKRVLQSMESLTVEKCPRLKNLFTMSMAKSLGQLQYLGLGGCGEMEYIVAREEEKPDEATDKIVIPRLERWTVTKEDVVMMQQDILGNLRELTLECYNDENVALPSNFFLQRFPNLEELRVTSNSFEEIFPETFPEEAFGPRELGNLKQLWLTNLRNLKQVWKDGSFMAEILKQIESLFVWECHRLSIVFPSPTSFQSLRELEVRDCNGLVHMGTCSAVTSLVYLSRLTLAKCGAMEDVVKDDGTGMEEIYFRKLEELILHGLPNLESFSPAGCAFMFPSLVHATVTQCPKMNIFCKGGARTPELDKLFLSDEDGEGHWEGDLNTTIQSLST